MLLLYIIIGYFVLDAVIVYTRNAAARARIRADRRRRENARAELAYKRAADAEKLQQEKQQKNERKIELLRMQSKQLKLQRARILEYYAELELEYPDAGVKRQQAIKKELYKLDDKIYTIDFKRAKLYNEYLSLSGAA